MVHHKVAVTAVFVMSQIKCPESKITPPCVNHTSSIVAQNTGLWARVSASLLYICLPEEKETYLKTATFAYDVCTVSSEGATHRRWREMVWQIHKTFAKHIYRLTGKHTHTHTVNSKANRHYRRWIFRESLVWCDTMLCKHIFLSLSPKTMNISYL